MERTRATPTLRARHRALLACALAIALPCHAQSQSASLRIDYELGLMGLHTDNVELAPGGGHSETILAPTLSVDARKDSADVQLRARGSFQYLDYRSGRYDDEAVGDFAGQLNWFVVPDRVALAFADYLGRAPVDITGGLTPGNQQEINVFTAGPSFYFRPGDATRGQIDLRFADTRSDETSEFDGNRYTGALRLLHLLSPNQTLSANLEGTKVDFGGGPGTDYERYDLYAGYLRDSDRIDIELAGGYSRIERDDAGGVAGLAQRLSGPLARVNIGWQVAPRSRIDIDARHEFADSATDLIARSSRFDEPVIEDLSSPNVLVSASLYRVRRLELGYQYESERFTAYVRPYVERIRYEERGGADWDSRGAYVDLRYKLRPRLELQAWGLSERRELMDARTDRDTSVRLGLSYEFSRRLRGFVGAQRRERNSSLPGQDYRENSVMAGLYWRR